MYIDKRGTGRTTRMIYYAKQLHGHGKIVYIFVATGLEVIRIKNLLGPQYKDEIEVKILHEALENGVLETRGPLAIRGMRPVEVSIDHFAIECEFGSLMRELVAYDVR